jgi:hypothetical protein
VATDKNKYIIVEINYEYNDEVYRQNDEAGRPVKVFDSEAQAETERRLMEALERSKIDSDELSSYCGYECEGDDCKHEGVQFYTIVPVPSF